MATPKVTIGKRKVRGETRWAVSRREHGKRKRTFFTSKDAADAEAERIRSEIQRSGSAWFNLPAADRDALMVAWDESKKLGVDLYAALKSAHGKPLTGHGPPLRAVIDELIKAKTAAGRASRYTSTLQIILDQFAASLDETRPVGRIDLADLEKYLDSKKLASRPTLRSRLSTLFKFAVRRGYRLDNPCSRLESVTVPKAPPAIFNLIQVQAALQWLQSKAPRALPWFVLTTFCGLRPEEAEKTTRADIHFAEGWIKIEAQTSKLRQRRIVYPKQEAMDLLKKVVKRGRMPIGHQARRRVIRGLRTHLGMPVWPKDVTRHTAASYWLASSQSAAAVAESLGNSETVLKRHYKALVTEKDARAFWRLVGRA